MADPRGSCFYGDYLGNGIALSAGQASFLFVVSLALLGYWSSCVLHCTITCPVVGTAVRYHPLGLCADTMVHGRQKSAAVQISNFGVDGPNLWRNWKHGRVCRSSELKQAAVTWRCASPGGSGGSRLSGVGGRRVRWLRFYEAVNHPTSHTLGQRHNELGQYKSTEALP